MTPKERFEQMETDLLTLRRSVDDIFSRLEAFAPPAPAPTAVNPGQIGPPLRCSIVFDIAMDGLFDPIGF